MTFYTAKCLNYTIAIITKSLKKMKKTFFLAFLMLFSVLTYAQITCPISIKTSGQSTPSNPIFYLPNGQNGCSESWPDTITVNGFLIYDFVSCSGGNLKYIIQSGQIAPSTFEMSINFDSGIVCSYNANGDLLVLSAEGFKKIKAKTVPNPTASFISIELDPLNMLVRVSLYSMSGQLVDISRNQSKIDVSNVRPGVYILRIETKNGTIHNKIIKD